MSFFHIKILIAFKARYHALREKSGPNFVLFKFISQIHNSNPKVWIGTK